MAVFAQTDLRAFCRDMGVPVTFQGVSTYADTGELILGLFDRPVQLKMGGMGYGGVEIAKPSLTLPYNAFAEMPDDGDTITVDGANYTVYAPTAEDDGAFTNYELKLAD